jgi:hypothetical protein
MLFASCASNESKKEAPSQAQIDSSVNAKVAEQEAMMKAKNDSIVAERSKFVADSMAKTEVHTTKKTTKGGGTKTTKTTTTTTTVTTPPPPPAPGGLKSQSDQNQAKNPGTGGHRSLKEQADKK